MSLLFLFCSQICFAQSEKVQDTVSRVATVTHKLKGNAIEFTPQTPQLEQIAGAPKAFYSYFWELGDGTYSREERPQHTYKSTGNYEVKLWATNNYDTGKPPTSRPQKITVTNADPSLEDEAQMTQDLVLLRNREPMPEEDIVVVMGYKNYLNYTSSGKLYLFYNEQQYKADNFQITDLRTHHDEKPIQEHDFVYTKTHNDLDRTYTASADARLTHLRSQVQDTTIKANLQLTLKDAKTQYRDWETLEFKNMAPNEERNLFFTLRTPPDMLKDTSAIISIRGVYVPDATYDNHKVKDMEMEIVTSHDPNKMASNGTFMNYRLVRFKNLKYKIKFQNNGEGPANTIRLETDIPDMLDKHSIEVIDMYPKCKICPDYEVRYSCLDTAFIDNKAIFTFKNIYLPGSEQKNVKVYDSTKGFVKYKIKFAKDFHKKSTKSKTAIYFDKNDPIITNYSTTRFLPGISIGAKAGYNSFADLKNSESYFVGATISTYKSYRWYWQVELMNSFHSYNSDTSIVDSFVEEDFNRSLQRTTTANEYHNIDWEIPILVRYNINNYIGIGAGVQAMFSVYEKQKQSILVEKFEGLKDDYLMDSKSSTVENDGSFQNLRSGVLFDLTAGFARIGPSLGVRYVLNFKDDFDYLQLYAIWKF